MQSDYRSSYLSTSTAGSYHSSVQYSNNNNGCRSNSKSPIRGILGNSSRSSNRYDNNASATEALTTAFNRQSINNNLNESLDSALAQSYKSQSSRLKSANSSYLVSETLYSTKRSASSSSFLNKTEKDKLMSEMHQASFVDDFHASRPSPPLPPTPPIPSSPITAFPMRTPSPPPSPYYHSTRTPGSLSPSCSIPSLPSTGSVVSISSAHSPTVKTFSPDPVADLEIKNALKIEGVDISLDKENARNFLKMQLEKERGRDPSGNLYVPYGTRRVSRTSKDTSYYEEQQQYLDSIYNGNRSLDRSRKFSHDSRNYCRSGRQSVDSALMNNEKFSPSVFTNKSTEDLLVNNNSSCSLTAPISTASNGSVGDNIRQFNAAHRRHSCFAPPPVVKYDFRSRTLDRGYSNPGIGAYRLSHPPNSSSGSSVTTRYNSNRRATGDRNVTTGHIDSGLEHKVPVNALRRAPYTSSCSNLLADAGDSGPTKPGVNSNVPWKNHFLRRKSVSSLQPNHRDAITSPFALSNVRHS